MANEQDKTIIPITNNANHNGGRMGIGLWSSLKGASLWYDIASIFFLISLAVGAVTAVIIFLAGNAKEEYLRRDLKEKDLEIARLHKAVRPRMLDSQIFLEKLKGTLKAKVDILYKPDDDEAWSLASQIGWALNKLEWGVVGPRPIMATDIPIGSPMNKPAVPLSSRPSVILNPGLVLIAKKADMSENPFSKDGVKDPAAALSWALMDAGAGGGQINIDPTLPDGLIKVIVGQKN